MLPESSNLRLPALNDVMVQNFHHNNKVDDFWECTKSVLFPSTYINSKCTKSFDKIELPFMNTTNSGKVLLPAPKAVRKVSNLVTHKFLLQPLTKF